MRTGANAKTRTCRRWGRAAWVWPQRHEWLGDAHNSGTRCRWHEVEATTAQWPALPTHVRVESSSINDSRSGSDGRAQSGSAGYGGSRLAMSIVARVAQRPVAFCGLPRPNQGWAIGLARQRDAQGVARHVARSGHTW
jgi:hypothetical protein